MHNLHNMPEDSWFRIKEHHEAIISEWQKLIDNSPKLDWKAIGVTGIEDFKSKLAKGEMDAQLEFARKIVEYDEKCGSFGLLCI